MRTFDIPKIDRKSPPLTTSDSRKFIENVVGQAKKIHFMSRDGLCEVSSAYRNKATSGTSRFVMALHEAFAEHIPFSLSPEIIMAIMSQEVAQFVKDNSEDKNISSLFTKTPNEKPTINVEVNSFVYGQENPWLEGVVQFRSKMLELIPSSVMEYMLPKFSNTNLEIEVSHLISFMDAASKYYSYSMSTLCGIPSFRIEGTADDWEKIIKSATKLQELIPGLSTYFVHLIPELREIRNTVDGNRIDNDYWASIYKQENQSGGPYSNGWFNNFFAHVYTQDWKTKKTDIHLKTEKSFYKKKNYGHGSKLNNFPSGLSVVPFVWKYLGTEIPMNFVSGVTSVEMDNGYLTPKLGVAILERNEK